MPDKKLTDSEIVKALEDTLHRIKGAEHLIVPKEGVENLCNGLEKTLDLINHQQAEIGKLRYNLEAVLDERADHSEAIKEFAERSEKEIFIKQDDERKQMLKILKTYRGTRTYSDTEQATDNWLRGYGEAVQDILCVFNNLLKEMVGDNNG